MKPILDWKFWLTIAATVAGVVVPIWLWRFDLSARGLDIQVQSKTALSPPVSQSTLGLRLSYDGQDLVEPYSSIIDLRNSGAKPILASEIEGNLEILVAKPSRLLRALVVKRQPDSLAPILTTEVQRVLITPLLLNPGDSITIEVLTDGASPKLSTRARIAGVTDISLQESPLVAKVPSRMWISAALSPFALSGVFMFTLMWRFPQRTFAWPLIILAGLSCTALVSLSLAVILDAYMIKSFAAMVLVVLAVTLSGAAFSVLFFRMRATP